MIAKTLRVALAGFPRRSFRGRLSSVAGLRNPGFGVGFSALYVDVDFDHWRLGDEAIELGLG
jgi:hypothetical protein